MRATIRKSWSRRAATAAVNFATISPGRDDFLAGQMAATFGEYLVFQVQARQAGPLELAHRPRHVSRPVAEAGVGVHQRRDAHGVGDVARPGAPPR